MRTERGNDRLEFSHSSTQVPVAHQQMPEKLFPLIQGDVNDRGRSEMIRTSQLCCVYTIRDNAAMLYTHWYVGPSGVHDDDTAGSLSAMTPRSLSTS